MVKKEIIFLSAVTLLILLSLNFVFSVHTATPPIFTVNVSQTTVFNITVNNTLAGDGTQHNNITQLNITLPMGFTFIVASNDTSLKPNAIFKYNITLGNNWTVLSWTNTSQYLINSSTNNSLFWFTASTPGVTGWYNFSVNSLNGSSSYQTNISIHVVDTTAPSVTLIYPTNELTMGTSDLAGYTIIFKFNVSDASLNITNCSLILNGVPINFNSTTNISGFTNQFINNTSGATNTWYVNCTDSDNNVGNSTTWTFYATLFTAASTASTGGSSATAYDLPVSVSGVESGVTRYVSTTASLKFVILNDTHYVKLTSVDVAAKKATVTVSSTPQTFTLAEDEVKKVDLNNDNVYDLEVKVSKIISTGANIYVKKISEPVTAPLTPEEQKVVEEKKAAEENKAAEEKKAAEPAALPTLWIVFIVIIISAVVILLVYKKKKARY